MMNIQELNGNAADSCWISANPVILAVTTTVLALIAVAVAEAEFVPLGVLPDLPQVLVEFAVRDGPQFGGAGGGRGEVVGDQVEMNAVLDRLPLRDPLQGEAGAQTGPVLLATGDLQAEEPAPESGEQVEVDRVDDDAADAGTHVSSGQVFSVLGRAGERHDQVLTRG